ncbi:MAG: HipA domain-containing protein, partial [Alphaproteobacteria bacterium]
RFDRRWTKDGRLIRLPQEDCCQALSVPPDRKYQSQGGPGLVDLLKLLAGSDAPQDNRETVFKAAVLFWLIGATDGHAKNFSLFLNPGGGYRLTPLYDVLTAQPSLDARQIERKHMRLAMSVGRSNHTRFETVFGRHFVETALAGGLAKAQALSAIDTLCETLPAVLDTVSVSLPAGFPDAIVTSVRQAALSRRDTLTRTLEAKA